MVILVPGSNVYTRQYSDAPNLQLSTTPTTLLTIPGKYALYSCRFVFQNVDLTATGAASVKEVKDCANGPCHQNINTVSVYASSAKTLYITSRFVPGGTRIEVYGDNIIVLLQYDCVVVEVR